MKYILAIICFLLLAGSFLPALAQDEPADRLPRDVVYRQVIAYGRDSLNCYLSYPSGNGGVVATYGNNPVELGKLDAFINRAFNDPHIFVRTVVLTGYCSIEGLYLVNDDLATKRAVKMKEYLNERYGLSARCPLRVDNVAEDWVTLRRLVAASPASWRTHVLAIIDSTGIFDGREKELMQLDGGGPYREMKQAFFPMLRRVEVKVEYDLRKIIEVRYCRPMTDLEFNRSLKRERYIVMELNRLEMEQQIQRRMGGTKTRLLTDEDIQREAVRRADSTLRGGVKQEKKEPVVEQKAVPATLVPVPPKVIVRPRRLWSPHVGIKTNLLGWAGITAEFERTTFMPNLSAEVFFCKRWSAEASGVYADFDYAGGKHWDVSGYSVEPRFWLKRDGTYRGFYFGMYGQAGDFNVMDGTADNHTGMYWQSGLSLGYYLPLSRHWGFEAGVRGGYQQADVMSYEEEDEHYYRTEADRSKNRLGLMRINVSVNYRF